MKPKKRNMVKKTKKKVVKKPKKVLIKKKVKLKTKKRVVKKVRPKKKISKKIAKKIVRKIVKKKKIKSNPTKAKGILTGPSQFRRRRIRSGKRKISSAKSHTPFLAESFFKAKIKVIGVGGGGGSIVSEIGRSLHKATFVVADTDARAFKKRAGIKNFLFGQKLTHGLGTGVNPQLGRDAALAEKERITQFFKDQDIVIFIASLGGGLGSGATQIFAEAAKDFNGITFGIFTLPFKFEGKNKYKIAVRALRALRRVLNVSVTIPNERIFKIIDANTAITDAFSIVNKSLIESLESLIDLIYSPGIINIDFADLRAILNGKGNLAFLNTVEASGKNRAEDIAKKILHNPLYQTNNFITEKILFNIEGGGNLGMFEVDKISKAISALNPKSKIIFGISKNSSLKNKIKTTLLMTGPSNVKEEIVLPPPATKKVTVKKAVVAKAKKKPVRKLKKAKTAQVPKKDTLAEAIEKFPVGDVFAPVFTGMPADLEIKKLQVVEAPVERKKTIRRNALEIKKAEEEQEKKQSLQEKEWEIPAFLRLKK